MNRHVCIVLARPTMGNDPCLMRAEGGNALARTLSDLAEVGGVSRSVLSVSDVVPAGIRTELEEQGFDVVVSHHDQPQHRLLEVMDDLHADTVVVLTSYSLLPDAAALAEASRIVAAGGADMVFADEVIPPKFFMVINRQAATLLAETVERPVPPFVFPTKLGEANRDGRIVIQPLRGLEESGERFLWELFSAGKPNALPAPVFERFLAGCAPERRFDREAFRSFILGEYGLGDLTGLEAGLARMRRWDSSIRLAMHINYAGHLAPHFPETRGAALEIGYGKTGMTAQLVGLAFARTMGVDPFKHSIEGFQTTRAFLSDLSESGLLPVPVLGGETAPPHFINSRLEEAGLESGAIDFCFSRMVLEHIDNMSVLARELGRIMRPGGVMIHEIGTQDHEDLSHIHFEFLRHSPEEWAAMDKGTNLLRPCDFVALFEAEGFDCEILERDVRIVRPKRLHPHWEGYADEDLYCPRVVIKSVRRAD